MAWMPTVCGSSLWSRDLNRSSIPIEGFGQVMSRNASSMYNRGDLKHSEPIIR
jgi:hypothetical protein